MDSRCSSLAGGGGGPVFSPTVSPPASTAPTARAMCVPLCVPLCVPHAYHRLRPHHRIRLRLRKPPVARPQFLLLLRLGLLRRPPIPASSTPELPLPGQLAFKTSSQKKRKLASPRTHGQDPLDDSPSPDSVLPSCETDDDPALSFSAVSFSATPVASGPDTPSYLRADSQPASSLPPRLQQQASLVSADYASSAASAASSPSASTYADLSIESDRGGDDTGPFPASTRSQSPFRVSRRAIMNGDADIPHRSSSPLKRRASSMDPDNETAKARDVEMATSQITDSADASQQPSGALPRAMSLDAPETSAASDGSISSSQPVPPLHEQVQIIETLLKAFAEEPMKDGAKAYLVSRSWVDKALSLRSDSKETKAGLSTEPLGPVDNSDIIEEVMEEPNGAKFVRLKPGSGDEEFQLFSEDAWKMVVDWYGVKDGQQAIIRTAINAAESEAEPNIMYEYHPPIFRIHRLWSEVSPLPIEQSLKAKDPAPLVLARSRSYRAQAFLKDIKTFTGVPMDRKIRLWMAPQPIPVTGPSEPRRALTPPDSPGHAVPADSWSKLLLDVASFAQVRDERIKVPLNDQTNNENYNGKASLHIYELNADQTLVIDEAVDQFWVSTYTGRQRGNDKAIPTRGNALASASAPVSGRNSPAPGGPLTRGRAQKKSGRSIGAVGLQNLGNTCYMNSALQCVRSVEELTKYFLTGTYSDEVNKTNPLGYNGKVAMAYGNLLKEIYMEGKGSVSPRDFKTTVGRCRSTFSGWGQQDTQEFLGFLLDGLQEDLSRIKKKPYIEKPDSTDDMINNPEAIRAMADKVWEITRLRDDSVIADLFTGMYKSTLKCPECGKISITFDPFNNLTLPLPVEDMWAKSVKFLPLNDVPVLIEVELPKHSAIEQLKQFLSTRTGVPVERLIGAEEFKDRFFKIYDNTQDVSEEIQASDIPTIHELEVVPTNWPHKARSKKFRSMLDIDTPLDATEWDDPRYEKMVVPVFHRRPHNHDRNQETSSPPHFICLTKAEASNIDLIQRKVLEKVATFSTWSGLQDPAEAETLDNTDSDVVITSASDADSSGDSKVVAHSVEGEDDMVDVTMKDVATNDAAKDDTNHVPIREPHVLKNFNTKRPKFINPDRFLDPDLQNMFELSYFTDNSDGAVPTGWSNVDHHRTLPKVLDRVPEPSSEREDEHSPESSTSTTSGNDEDSTNDEGSKADMSQTRMLDESSEEDVLQPARVGPRSSKLGPAGRKKFKGHKTYGKKGNKRRDKQMRNGKAHKLNTVKPHPTPPAVADGGPLIRLGEGLVVDWNEEAWEKVFGGSPRTPTEDQGTRTFVEPESLNDPALKIRQRKRHHRRTRGITLDDCLDEFERAEILSEQDMWYCPRCKEHRRASKKFDLWKTPDILVAHLKRFSSSGWRRDKLDVLVDFPVEGLDLTTRVIQKEEGKEEIYDLIAVDDHYGGLGGGHYTAYAKNFVDGRWYNYNDSSVSHVADPSTAVTEAAYLLFYRRRTSVPLGGSRFGAISEKYEDDEEEEEDGDETGSGEDRRLGEGSSLTGSSSALTGAAATRPQTGRGSDRVTVSSLAAPDDYDEDQLPTYEGPNRIEMIHDSIEDEGTDIKNAYQPLPAKSLSLAQPWNFEALGGSGAEGSTGADFASDEVQMDSSADEQVLGQEYYELDTEMTGGGGVDEHVEPPAPNEGEQAALADIQNATWERKGVISLSAAAETDQDSNEVAEIHLEGDKGARAD
ncbi:hypothetical protein AK830_g5925 [Neonectria ditissima]|uniref:ubiquitinyl hydrolase 1 n=1 Tax=Neonectria ditissima TaxID=78410 RepID=A0A0P7BJS8_9HYPO|nr:hypothetical protein AK830_g5925 [Neonectria ditissima]